jgi:phosphodiesterase/alkaline phosphatase D-like protein
MLNAVSFILLVVCLSSCAHGQAVTRGPIVGGVTDSSARVTVVASSSAPMAIEYSMTNDFSSDVQRSTQLTPDPAKYNFLTFNLPNLHSSSTYFLRPVVNDASSHFATTRSFRTFPKPLHDSAFMFAFGSCQLQQIAVRRSNVWKELRALQPLLFIQMGDWTYPDRAISPAFASNDSLLAQSYLNKYDPTQGIDSVLASLPVDYVWDDHDFGANNSDGTFADKAKSLNAFTSYVPHYNLPNAADGIYHTFTVGNVQFFVLDLRSERSPDNEVVQQSGGKFSWNPPTGHSILRGTHTSGVDQLRWFENALLGSLAKWKVIISSVTWSLAAAANIPLLVTYANFKKDGTKLYEAADTWAGFSADQDSILAFVKKYQITNVVVCSADVHTAMMDDGRNSAFPEIVSGNLEVPNSNLYGQLDSVGFGTSWDKGGQIRDSLNTYGRITVETTPVNRLHCEIVNERDSVISSMYIGDSASHSNVFMPLTPFPAFGVKILSNVGADLLASASLEDRSVAEIYITDALGKEVKRVADGTIDPGSWRFKLTLANLPSGNYFFVLHAKDRKWTAPFHIVH